MTGSARPEERQGKHLDIIPQSAGLRAIAEGFHLLGLPDEERLRLGFPIYDALLDDPRSPFLTFQRWKLL